MGIFFLQSKTEDADNYFSKVFRCINKKYKGSETVVQLQDIFHLWKGLLRVGCCVVSYQGRMGEKKHRKEFLWRWKNLLCHKNDHWKKWLWTVVQLKEITLYLRDSSKQYKRQKLHGKYLMFIQVHGDISISFCYTNNFSGSYIHSII